MSELYYNVFRWYDVRTGRYTGPDPLGVFGGENVFRYARSSPTLFTDPDGLTVKQCFHLFVVHTTV